MGMNNLELRYLLKDPSFYPFSFDYDFYCDDDGMKKEFEMKFIERYYFNEINSETVARWKWQLKSRLHLVMPMYRQLYESELKSKDIEFLLNKDLRETFSRTLDNDREETSTNTASGNANTQSQSDSKRSDIADGVSSVNLNADNLTAVGNAVDVSSSDNTSTSQTSNVNKDKSRETTELTSKGNIGTTSSATLLKEWRSVMLNLDKQLIDECRELFMIVY